MKYQINFTDGTIEYVNDVLFVKIEKSDFFDKGYEYLTFKTSDYLEAYSYNISDVLNFTAIAD